VLCALALFGLCERKMNFKISSEPRLGPFGFQKNKTPKVLFENQFKKIELENNLEMCLN